MVTPQFRPGETLSAAKLQQLGDIDTSWFPTLQAFTTNPTLGIDAIQQARIWVNGQHVNIWFWFRFGNGSTAGSGTYEIPLPPAYPLMAGLIDTTFGTHRLLDDSATGRGSGVCGISADGQFIYLRNAEGGTGVVAHNVPWAWAANDWILGHVSYLTDFGA